MAMRKLTPAVSSCSRSFLRGEYHPINTSSNAYVRSLPYPAVRRYAAETSKPSNTEPKTALSELSSNSASQTSTSSQSASSASSKSSASSQISSSAAPKSESSNNPQTTWEDQPDVDIDDFSSLPGTNFGDNQNMIIPDEFKDVLKQIPWKFPPIRYCFAYGSGVFPQSKPTTTSSDIPSVHAKAPAAVIKAQGGTSKMIDFIFGVSFTEHWHSLNIRQNRNHYSFLGAGPFATWQVSKVQENFGAGVYYNTYIMVNGLLIKYGVVNLDVLRQDLSTWNTLYIAGRLHKPVKILRDDAKVRFANQINLLSALRTALLLLPPSFTEMDLYGTIASISYMGDPRMSLPTEDPGKVANIVGNNLTHFRRLYEPIIGELPNVQFDDPLCSEKDWKLNPGTNVRLLQDMDPSKRGNMVRRLPTAFRDKLYFQYQKKYQIPQLDFNKIMDNPTNRGGGFEQRIIAEPVEDLRTELRGVIKKTIWWPSTVQSGKGLLTAGVGKSMRYMREKVDKSRQGKKKLKEEAAAKLEETAKGESESEKK